MTPNPNIPGPSVSTNLQEESELEAMLLFDALLRGPNEAMSWATAVHDLGHLLDTDPRVIWSVVDNPDANAANKNSREQLEQCLSEFREKARAYQSGNKKGGEDLENLAMAVNKVLAAQGRRPRSEEGILVDYATAGCVVRSSGEYSWIRDAYDIESQVPNEFLNQEYNFVLKEEGRDLKRDHCVRLITDSYAGLGLPKGVEGYMFRLLSNKSLGGIGNFCQVLFIIGYDSEDQSLSDDWQEVKDEVLQVCDDRNPPSDWFPILVQNGVVQRGDDKRLKIKPGATSYNSWDLMDILDREQSTNPARADIPPSPKPPLPDPVSADPSLADPVSPKPSSTDPSLPPPDLPAGTLKRSIRDFMKLPRAERDRMMWDWAKKRLK